MKRILIICLIITIMAGAGGCMNTDKIATGSTDNYTNSERDILIQESVVSYLNEKYNESFEIIKFAVEFSGEHGDFIRAVCSTATDDEKCVVYGYSDICETDASVDMNGKTYYLTDDYANVILQRGYAETIKKALNEDVMIKCQLFIPDHMLTDEEFASGLECLGNPDLRAQAYIYVFVDGKYTNGKLRENIEKILIQHKAFKQYLYVIYQSGTSYQEWENIYYDNYSSFERYLNYDCEADFIEFSSFSLEEGYKGHEIVRGEA